MKVTIARLLPEDKSYLTRKIYEVLDGNEFLPKGYLVDYSMTEDQHVEFKRLHKNKLKEVSLARKERVQL